MRRTPVHFCEDLTEQELVAMARDHGFVVRHVGSMTVVDRVPNWVRREERRVIQMPDRTLRKVRQ